MTAAVHALRAATPEPTDPALVPCDGCGGTGFMWAGTGLEMEQVRVACCACDGAGVVEEGEEPADPDGHGAPFDEPEPPTPAAPNVIPFRPRRFDRAEHCRAIAAGGGARTVALYGTQHMRAIGKAGARATIAKHGLDTFKGIVTGKGWAGPRTPSLAADLSLGRYLADLDPAA